MHGTDCAPGVDGHFEGNSMKFPQMCFFHGFHMFEDVLKQDNSHQTSGTLEHVVFNERGISGNLGKNEVGEVSHPTWENRGPLNLMLKSHMFPCSKKVVFLGLS